jgi:hypothetical protein
MAFERWVLDCPTHTEPQSTATCKLHRMEQKAEVQGRRPREAVCAVKESHGHQLSYLTVGLTCMMASHFGYQGPPYMPRSWA